MSIDCFAKIIYLRIPDRAELVVAVSRGNPLAEAFLAHIEKGLQRDQIYCHAPLLKIRWSKDAMRVSDICEKHLEGG